MLVCQSAGVGMVICQLVKTAVGREAGMFVGQTAGVGWAVCWSIKWLG